ncbi:MAG: DNA topoisomerase IB [Aliidongia sp.]
MARAKAAARSAKLRYRDIREPGIARRRAGKGWVYRDPDGALIRDETILARIRALAIPPAYREVWISPDPANHLQATGIDARGRVQYRYHPEWRRVRDEAKYDHVLVFAKALPRIRSQVATDLARRGLPRERVLATIVRLMETTLMRIGNQAYARSNKSFGLTTLRNRHVAAQKRQLHLSFRGKSGVLHEFDIKNPQLARIVGQLRELPGQKLFQYLDEDGARRSIDSSDVNDYLRDISGEQITAKDFRTWAGTHLAAIAFAELDRFKTKSATKKAMLRVVERVAKKLGNTPAICRKCYIHPAIFEAYLDGGLAELLTERINAELEDAPEGLTAEEAAVMALLARRLSGS